MAPRRLGSECTTRAGVVVRRLLVRAGSDGLGHVLTPDPLKSGCVHLATVRASERMPPEPLIDAEIAMLLFRRSQ
jgi:hypothetical protein